MFEQLCNFRLEDNLHASADVTGPPAAGAQTDGRYSLQNIRRTSNRSMEVLLVPQISCSSCNNTHSSQRDCPAGHHFAGHPGLFLKGHAAISQLFPTCLRCDFSAFAHKYTCTCSVRASIPFGDDAIDVIPLYLTLDLLCCSFLCTKLSEQQSSQWKQTIQQ